MKKSLLSLLIILMLLLIASCEPEVKHEHTWGKWTNSKAATCTEDGLSIRKCTSCGEQDENTQKIKALGHLLSTQGTVTKNATCSAEGEETYSCTREGCDHKETKTIPATGEHTYGEEQTKEATCTEDGKKYKVCSVCNTESVISIINAKGHSYNYKSDKDGHYQLCSNCNDQTTKVSHSFGEWNIDAEATESTEGKKHRSCTVCEYEDEETISKKEHTCVASENYSYDETSHWKECTSTSCNKKLEEVTHTISVSTTKAATCTEDGEKISKCNICGYKKTDTIEKLDHEWDEGTVTTNPTCINTGVKTFTCRRQGCTKTKTEIVPSTPDTHTLKEEKTIPATCTTDGESYKICSICNQKYDVTTIIAKGHTEKEQKTEDATCTSAGRSYKICSVCNAEYDIKTTEATGHSWGEWTTKATGTCTTPTKLSRSCSKCTATEEKDGDTVSTAHPTDSLTWKEETISFLQKTEKKEFCTSCQKETGNSRTDYDSIEGYWISDAIGLEGAQEYTAYYLYLSIDSEGNAVLEYVNKKSDGTLEVGYPQKCSYVWIEDETSANTLRTNIIFTPINSDAGRNYSISEDNSGEITLTNPQYTQETYTLTRKSTTKHSEHNCETVESIDEYNHHKITNCDSTFHEKLYIIEPHSFNEDKTCESCGYTEPYEIPLFVYEVKDGSVSETATYSFYNHKIDRNTTLYPTASYSFMATNENGTKYEVEINGITEWKTAGANGIVTYPISNTTPIKLEDGMAYYIKIYYSTNTTE